MQLEFSKYSNIKFNGNPSSGSRIVPCVQTARQTVMTKLTVAFHKFSKRPLKAYLTLTQLFYSWTLTDLEEIMYEQHYIRNLRAITNTNTELTICNRAAETAVTIYKFWNSVTNQGKMQHHTNSADTRAVFTTLRLNKLLSIQGSQLSRTPCWII
jgi:hypothetical protein